MNSGSESDEILIALSLARQLAEKSIAALPADRKAAGDAFLRKLASLPGDWTALIAPTLPTEQRGEQRKPASSRPQKHFNGFKSVQQTPSRWSCKAR